MNFIGLEKDVAIEHPMVNRAIAKAQHKVEQRNFQARKQLLEYDDIANEQRNVVYSNRYELLNCEDIAEYLSKSVTDAAEQLCQKYIPSEADSSTWQLEKLEQVINATFKHSIQLQAFVNSSMEQEQQIDTAQLHQYISDKITGLYADKLQSLDAKIMLDLQRQIVIQVIDHLWKNQLQNMDQLRQGIHFRSYAQKSPKQEYKRESFEMFKQMWNSIGIEFCKAIFSVDFARIKQDIIQRQQAALEQKEVNAATASLYANKNTQLDASKTNAITNKQGRNEACLCGSGKKFKQCCGA